MANSNGIITAPVSIADVKTVLGASSNDLATLCKHANINIWAKYKPESYAVIGQLTDTQRANNKFGLTPYSTTSFANIVTQTTGGMNGWVYTRPSGGSSSPYRLADFAGYNRNAVQMTEDFAGTTKTAANKTFSAGCSIAISGADNVAFQDFGTSMYFGVAFLNSSNTVVLNGTGPTVNGTSVSFTIPSSLAQGTYKVYPFFCNKQITPSAGGFSGTYTFWSVPNVSYYSCLITSASALTGIVASGKWFDSNHSKLTITVKNTSTTSDYTGAIYVRRTGRTWSDYAAYPGETTSETLTFNKGTSVSKIYTGFSKDYNYHAQVRLSTAELYEVAIMEYIEPELELTV